MRALWQDVLGRFPDDAELAEARTALRQDAGREGLARRLLDRGAPSLEAGPDRRSFVAAQFGRLIGRAPTTRELETYAAALEGSGSGALVVRALVTSGEYERY